MNISAANCTPIKPQSFGMKFEEDNQSRYQHLIETADTFQSGLVEGSDIKNPAQIAASVGVLGVKTFALGMGAAGLLTAISGGKIPNAVISGLKKASSSLVSASQKLANANTGKLAVLKNQAGKGIAFAEKHAHNLYNSVISNGAKDNTAKQFSKLLGFATAAAATASACKIDNNGDGVKDITQKSQSIYNTTKTNCDKLIQGASLFSEISSILT